jgi:hypothetical protein
LIPTQQFIQLVKKLEKAIEKENVKIKVVLLEGAQQWWSTVCCSRKYQCRVFLPE